MRVESTVRPGARGSKKYVKAYGERLVCVRTRRDDVSGRRFTTVELIVDERDAPVNPRVTVGVRIRADERVLQQRVRAAGGRWSRRHRLWALPLGAVEALDLQDRMVRPLSLPTSAGGSRR